MKTTAMKRTITRILCAALAVAATLTLAACAKTETPPTAPPAVDATPTPTAAPTPTATVNSGAWKQLYIEYINENLDPRVDEITYSLLYIDDDDVPELLVRYYSVAGDYYSLHNYSEICTAAGDELDYMGMSIDFYYIERGNLIAFGDNRMDYYGTQDYVYAIQNGKFVCIFMVEIMLDMDADVELDANGEPIWPLLYFLDGEEISETNYQQSLAAAFDLSRATYVSPDSSGHSYDEIIAIIEGM